jgi:hypothetical protein
MSRFTGLTNCAILIRLRRLFNGWWAAFRLVMVAGVINYLSKNWHYCRLTKVIQNTLKGLILYNKCIKYRLAFVLGNSNLKKIKKAALFRPKQLFYFVSSC